jgi:hypothetical protein
MKDKLQFDKEIKRNDSNSNNSKSENLLSKKVFNSINEIELNDINFQVIM